MSTSGNDWVSKLPPSFFNQEPISNDSSFTTKKRVYICGKVTGLPWDQTVMKFNNADIMLQAKGFEPVNPLLVVGDPAANWEQAMRKCIAALLTCDMIYLLPDHVISPGGRLEFEIATQLGITTLNL